MHSTNYTNAFIEVADDCPTAVSTVPPEKHTKTIARMQYELIVDNPYQYTSDDVVFAIHAARTGIPAAEYHAQRAVFFAQGRPCLRVSPLGKRYGWGIHYDSDAKMALYARESDAYARLKHDSALTHLKAMKRTK